MGQAQLAAAKLAQEDLNTFFEKIKLSQRVALLSEDTEGNPAIALEKLKELKKRGARIVIGPNTSACVKECLEFANRMNMILISPASTTLALANPHDNLIRMSLNDQSQAEAMANTAYKQGIEHVLCLTRKDVWGTDLHKLFREKFRAAGGMVYANVYYSPQESDLTPRLEQLNKLVQDAVFHHGRDKVAIQFSGFEEGVTIFELASQFPQLQSVKWLGSDGFAHSQALFNSPKAVEFAQKVAYEAPAFDIMEEQSYLFKSFKERMAQKGFYQVDVYIGNAYDATWLVGMAGLGQNKRANIKAWKKALDSVASHNLGITGWAILDENGDRTTGEFVTWKLPAAQPGQVSSELSWEATNRYKKDLPNLAARQNPSPRSSFKAGHGDVRTYTEEIELARKEDESIDRIKRLSQTSSGRFYQ